MVVYKDGEKYREFELSAQALPQRISIPVKGCLQIKLLVTALGGNNPK